MVLPRLVPADRGELDRAFHVPVLDQFDTFEELRDIKFILPDFDVLRDAE